MLHFVSNKTCLVRLLITGERLVRMSSSDLCWRVLLLVAVAGHFNLVSNFDDGQDLGVISPIDQVATHKSGAAKTEAEDDLYEILDQPRTYPKKRRRVERMRRGHLHVVRVR